VELAVALALVVALNAARGSAAQAPAPPQCGLKKKACKKSSTCRWGNCPNPELS